MLTQSPSEGLRIATWAWVLVAVAVADFVVTWPAGWLEVMASVLGISWLLGGRRGCEEIEVES